MSNYFDNQDKWSWNISEKEVLVTTDHGDHTHTLDITNVPIGEMVDNTGQVMGDAHRAASHNFKEDAGVDNLENTNIEENTIGNNVTEDIQTDTSVEEDNGIDGGEDCDDGLDI